MSVRAPSYRQHRPSGQAVVTLNGHDFYLGPWKTPQSRAEYDRLIAEWLANGRRLPGKENASGDVVVNEVILAFLKHAEGYYSPEGRELNNFKLSLRPLRDLYGRTPVREFGPRALKAVRQRMIERGWCRNVINRRVTRIKTMFRWAESEELIPASTFHALQTVQGLRKGTPGVRDTPPVQPAFWQQVSLVLAHCTRPVAAMLQLQCLTGMRSCEVRIMRTCDIDQTDPACWLYRPEHHKNDWRDDRQERIVPLGKECQRILQDWLRPESPEAFLFQPRQAVEERNAIRRARRQTPRTPSQLARKRKKKPKRVAGTCYSSNSYPHAVANACQKAGVKFHPYALRHGCKMRIQNEAGVDAARCVLGQRSIQATQRYGLIDVGKAVEVMTKLG